MTPYLYQYGIGLVVFVVGVCYAWRQGYIGFSGRAGRNLILLFVVFLFFTVLQGYLQFGVMGTADPVPYEGGVESTGVLGTVLDYGIMVGYFILILVVGTYFGRRQKTLKDFFFGGQRFSWWLITFSLVATTVGSYSFVKYSQVAFKYGMGSSQTYLNDWMWLPLFLFGWLPILYFSRIISIPEYFERRFDKKVRRWVTVYVLIYLIGYVGVNLFTMGKVLNILLGWPIPTAAIVVATISAIYVTAGGQTSVIMTDLLQGVMLLVTGVLILFLGVSYLGGLEDFWHYLPRGHRLAFPTFNEDPSFPGVGIFWQDGMANTAMFYFLNQGIIMRFMSAKSVKDGRKAMFSVVLILMPIAACVVASGGWVAKALVHAGILPPTISADEAFFVAANFLSRPGIFGLILATLTAALMSTVDTLITAVAAIFVNDVYRPIFNPSADEKRLLRVARISSVSVTILGILLVPVFMSFRTIYEAHGAFTAAVTPPLVVTLLFSVFWRRFTRKAALLTLVGGMGAILFSLFFPEVIKPFAHGVPMTESGDGFLSGMNQFKFMRAFYGLSISAIIGVGVTLFSKPEPYKKQKGLVWGSTGEILKGYNRSAKEESGKQQTKALPIKSDDLSIGIGPRGLPVVSISRSLADELNADEGDYLYISDSRWWLGGLNSAHSIVGNILDEDEATVILDAEVYASIVTPRREGLPVVVEKISQS